jgi:nucleoside 2-deoxyribosyltransferase
LGPAHEVVAKDLEGLAECDRVLALADGADVGTIFEIGYARARNVPVVVFSTTLGPEELKMLVGSGCTLCDDLCTAIYRTGWTA